MAARKSKRKPSQRSARGSLKSKSGRPRRVGPAFERLVAVMSRLRSPGGCPWDREQTHATLRTYLIEEAYEVLDALESSDDTRFAEELGDLLLRRDPRNLRENDSPPSACLRRRARQRCRRGPPQLGNHQEKGASRQVVGPGGFYVRRRIPSGRHPLDPARFTRGLPAHPPGRTHWLRLG